MKEEKKIPFVKLFRTPNARYLYDVPQSRLLCIQEDTYTYIENLKNGKEVSAVVPEEISELQDQGFLQCESPVEEIKHPYTDVIGTFLDRKLSMITLQLTQQCNFRCKYCVYSEDANKRQRSHSDVVMSFETAKKAIDFLWEHSVDSANVAIGFYGGEPLLQFPLIKKLVEYSKERFRGKPLLFSMTTNGSLLTEEVVAYLEENNVNLMVSMDGPKTINDRNRVFRNGTGTFDVVAKNFKEMKKNHPEYWKDVSISMVINPNNDLDEIGNIVSELGVEASKLRPSIVDCEYDNLQLFMDEEYICKQEYHRFLGYLAHWNRYPKEKVSPILQGIIENNINTLDKVTEKSPLKMYDAPSGPCVPGQLRLFVNVYGEFYPCERVSENSALTCIGDLEKGFDVEKAEQFLNAGRITKDSCRRCWAFRFCDQCGKRADSGKDHLDAKEKLKYCNATRHSAVLEIENYLLLNEIPNDNRDFIGSNF